MEKEKAAKNSVISKKLAEVVVCVKLYAIALSLPVTTNRKMSGYFGLISARVEETRYEKIVAITAHIA